VLFNKAKTVLICYPSRREATAYTIPGSVTTISERAFRTAAFLKSISIPEGVRDIGDFAFMECQELKTVALPASVTSIGENAFSWCTGLEAISVSGANPSYSSRDGVLFDKAGTVLLKYPGASRQTAYAVPNGVTRFSGDGFDHVYYLETIDIPASVTDMGGNDFGFSLREFRVDEANTAYCSRDGVLFNKAMTTLLEYPSANPRTDYTVPEGVTELDVAFTDCNKLKRVVIPYGVSRISGYGFCRCSQLKEIVIPESVTEIDSGAFSECTSLVSVSIPASVTQIGQKAFAQCSRLSDVWFKGNAPVIQSNAFDGCAAAFTVHYPAGASGYTNPWYGWKTVSFNSKTQLLAPTLSIDRTGSLLKGTPFGLSPESIKSYFVNNAQDIKVLDREGGEYTGGVMGTGMSLQLYLDGTAKDTLEVCIAGDVSGDGRISVADYTLIRLHLLGLKTQTDKVYKAAADVNGDGNISILDYTAIRLDILEISKIHAP
jgi:hypothetical protein